MTTAETERRQDSYALGRTQEEYDRQRAQARVWESATGRLLDQAGLAPGASRLDAGCGPGETMRLMPQRVGPAGRVLGIDVDASLGAIAVAALHRAGHRHCHFHAHDLTADGPIPSAPFDLVYARLLLFRTRSRSSTSAPAPSSPPRSSRRPARPSTRWPADHCPRRPARVALSRREYHHRS
jgi:SAM-dependent methyltransferase